MREVIAIIVLSACQLPAAGPAGPARPMGPAPGPMTAPGPAPTADPRRIVAMPDLTLMTRADAEEALRRAGFTYPPEIDRSSICGSTLDDRDRTIVELGRVCYQHPVPGAETRTSLPVRIRVQTEDPRRGELGGGRSWFLMPDLSGLDVASARAQIRALGFTGKEVEVSYVDDCAPDVVCRTYPEPKTRTDNTSDKVFYVGRPPKPPEPPPSAPPPPPARPDDIF
ncbi:MAG: PASTA domain-containing protein [Deltaproteobacteria bacterium]|nr:PASTA domain-containing protein [Deltaproteobacteria bacterium]